MASLFDSPRLTFARAQHHVNDFNMAVDSFVKGRPYAYGIDKDSQPGQDVHRIKFMRELPEMLPCVLFDVANNLRAVLDQTGYAAAIAGGKINPKATGFPFGDDLAGLDNNIVRRKVSKDVPTEIVDIFKGFKPYKGGNDTLWALNKICNTKKHVALVPLRIGNAKVYFSAEDGDGMLFAETPEGWDPDKREMTLMTTPAGTDPHITGHFTFSVSIDSIEVLRGQDARRVVHAMSNAVQSVLVTVEAECRRLRFEIGD
jgi:hypothetical protein